MRLSIRKLVSAVVFSLALLSSAHHAMATLIFVDTSIGGGQVGAFYGPYLPTDDPPIGYPPVPTPDNLPTFQNYFMGRTTVGGFTTSERRPFFFFDMSSISIPAGEEIISVSIDLELLPGGTSVLANFVTDDKEVVDFSSTTYTPGEILDPDTPGIPHEDIWMTFGSTTPYGGFEINGPLHASPTAPDTYTIPLPGAVPDLTDAITGGDMFILTAKLATYDPGPIGAGAPPADDIYEYVFGLTDVVVPVGPTIAAPELVITTAPISPVNLGIPEPSTCILTVIGLMLMRRHGRRRR